eukprot:ANDGO_06338.mRNA.1 Putative SWI/SNF-related matrix-associated actin-dependent regulator of chromatin subfamily A member 3-like 2
MERSKEEVPVSYDRILYGSHPFRTFSGVSLFINGREPIPKHSCIKTLVSIIPALSSVSSNGPPKPLPLPTSSTSPLFPSATATATATATAGFPTRPTVSCAEAGRSAFSGPVDVDISQPQRTGRTSSFSTPHWQQLGSSLHANVRNPVLGALRNSQPIGSQRHADNTSIVNPPRSNVPVALSTLPSSSSTMISSSNPSVGAMSAGSGIMDTSRMDVAALFDSAITSVAADVSSGVPEIEPRSCLKTSLLPHQKVALSWLVQREIGVRLTQSRQQFFFWKRMVDHQGNVTYKNTIKVASPQQKEHPVFFSGGFLCDDMGLGKTLSVIAMLAHFQSLKQRTLIVCPLSLISNWVDQINEHTLPGTFSVGIYHGPDRSLAANVLGYDVVISTYNILVMDYRQHADSIVEDDNDQNERKHADREEDDDDGDGDDDDDDGGRRGGIESYFFPQNRQSQSASSQARGPRSKRPKVDYGLFTPGLFHRVVYDEAHMGKNPETITAMACTALAADRRWCLTGTPITNKMDDLQSLMRIIHAEPFSDHKFWRNMISRPLKSTTQSDNLTGFRRLQIIVKALCLRRMKRRPSPMQNGSTSTSATHHPGPGYIEMPDLEIIHRHVEITGTQRIVYDRMYRRARNIVVNWLNSGGNSGGVIANVLALLTRLRQACNHLELLRETAMRIALLTDEEDAREAQKAGQSTDAVFLADDARRNRLSDVLSKLFPSSSSASGSSTTTPASAARTTRQGMQETSDALESPECAICFEEISDESTTLVTPCGHVFCSDCLERALSVRSLCPMCRDPVRGTEACRTISAVRRLLKKAAEAQSGGTKDAHGTTNAPDGSAAIANPYDLATAGAKLNALLHDLQVEIPSSEKVLVFSQWTSFLDLVEPVISDAQIPYVRLDGSMTREERAEAVTTFQGAPASGCRVFLISLKCGGFGLNLTAASHVCIMDPWWSWEVESQAADRAWRIGNKARKVVVRRYICTNTIEEKILELQKMKLFLTRGAFGESGDEAQSTDEFKRLRQLRVRLLFNLDKSVADLV